MKYYLESNMIVEQSFVYISPFGGKNLKFDMKTEDQVASSRNPTMDS